MNFNVGASLNCGLQILAVTVTISYIKGFKSHL